MGRRLDLLGQDLLFDGRPRVQNGLDLSFLHRPVARWELALQEVLGKVDAGWRDVCRAQEAWLAAGGQVSITPAEWNRVEVAVLAARREPFDIDPPTWERMPMQRHTVELHRYAWGFSVLVHPDDVATVEERLHARLAILRHPTFGIPEVQVTVAGRERGRATIGQLRAYWRTLHRENPDRRHVSISMMRRCWRAHHSACVTVTMLCLGAGVYGDKVFTRGEGWGIMLLAKKRGAAP